MKRILIATALGVCAGIVCALLGRSLGVKLTAGSFGWIMLNRTLLGFVIGISSLRMHWALHGGLIAVLVGSLFSYSAFMSGTPPLFAGGVLLGSIVFGVLIEFLTTVVFKLPAVSQAERQIPAKSTASGA